MPNRAIKPAALRESWRPDSANVEKTESRKRLAWQLSCSIALIALFSFFGYLLFSPFFHPYSKLFFLTAGSYETLDVRPIPYFQEDAVRFLASDGRFQQADAAKEFFLLESPDAARAALASIADGIEQPSDVALIHLSAHPSVIDGRAFLQCTNFNPTTPEQGAFSVQELLSLLDRIAAGTVLVCLDLGPSDLPSSGDSESESFLFLLREAMRSSNNANLWLLLSHSSRQQSYASIELRASVFSYAVSKGLQGDADLNRDSTIDLDEFHRFVNGFTQSYVDRESGGTTTQTPVLLTTSANANTLGPSRPIASATRPIETSSFLSYIPGFGGSSDDKKEETPEDTQKKANAEKSWLSQYSSKKSARIKERVLEEIEDNINFLPTFLGNRVKQSIGIGQEDPAEEANKTAKDKKQTTAPDSATTPGPNAENADTSIAQGDTNELDPREQFDKTAPDLSRIGDPKTTNTQLLQYAWQYCQHLEQPTASLSRPVDLVPHAWNEFVSYLHGIENRQRMDAVVSSDNVRFQLLAEILGSFQFASSRSTQLGTMIRRIVEQMPTLDLPQLQLPSLGMIENMALFNRDVSSAFLDKQIQQFDASLHSDTPEAFEKWFAELPKELTTQYIEFYWADEFASRPSTPWKVTRRVLGLWRRFERLAYDPLSSNQSLQNDLATTQQSLLEGTRTALDQIGSDWIDRSTKVLDRAEQLLENSNAKRTITLQATQLRNEVLADIPAILRWRRTAITRLGATTMDADVESLVGSLETLCEALIDREHLDFSKLIRSRQEIDTSLTRIGNVWTDEANHVIRGEQNQRSTQSWVTDALLETTFVRNQLRNRLLVLPVDPLTFETPKIDRDTRLSGLPAAMTEPRFIQKQLELESRVAALAGMPSDTTLPRKAPQAQPSATNDETTSGLQVGTASTAIDRFYRSLAATVSTGAISDDAVEGRDKLLSELTKLRRAEQSLRLLSPVDLHAVDCKPLLSKLWRMEFLLCVENKRELGRRSLQDALPRETIFHRIALERLAVAASALSGGSPASPLPPPRLVTTGTSNVSLIVETLASGEIVWRNVGKPITNAWILVEYDPDLLEVQGPTGIQYYQSSTIPRLIDEARGNAERDVIAAIAASSKTQGENSLVDEANRKLSQLQLGMNYPTNPAVASIPPTMGVGPGQELNIPFKIKRIGLGPERTKLIWKLIGDGEYVRHEVDVLLPASEKLRFIAEGASNSWGPTHEGIVLYPWPNRPTEFRIGLRNESNKARIMSVQMFALNERRDVTIPDGFLSPAATQDILARLGDTKLIAFVPEWTVDVSPEPAWLPLLPLPDPTPPPAGSDAPPTMKPTGMENGAVIVFTDKANEQRYVRRVDTRVRHPRSYIEPTASYNAVSERIDIRLRSLLPDALPVEGVAVKGRIAEPLPRGTELKLDGIVLEREPASLYCQVPSIGPRELTFELDVDGFPRAFVIKVPCWRTNNNIPITQDSQRIEILEPLTGISLNPNDPIQKVKLRIDAVAGSFETKRDMVEIGWDLDRDREFMDETTFRFGSDRQVDVSITSIALGRITMKTEVRDVVIEVPPPAVKNDRVNLLARLTAGGETVWSNSVEVIADSESPTITGVELDPGATFAQAKDLVVRVGVDDAKLSGVVKVEVVIDSKGVGKFEDVEGAPKTAERQPDGAWTVTLPTKAVLPGRSTLLVRATDRVGNKSEVSKTVLEIISEQEWESRLKSAVQEVSGTVLYSDNPLTNAKVTIEDEKGNVVHKAMTDGRGMFRIPSVQVGKYKLVAIGTMKNRPRRAERTLEIEAPPAPPPRLRLIAK